MSDPSPTPPPELPDEFVELLEDCPAERLRQLARYAKKLAECRERETGIARADSEDEVEARPAEMPDDVPSKATLTIKEINDNRYYYWQWRDGDQIKSRYRSPVESDDE